MLLCRLHEPYEPASDKPPRQWHISGTCRTGHMVTLRAPLYPYRAWCTVRVWAVRMNPEKKKKRALYKFNRSNGVYVLVLKRAECGMQRGKRTHAFYSRQGDQPYPSLSASLPLITDREWGQQAARAVTTAPDHDRS